MKVVNAYNVNHALYQGLKDIQEEGLIRPSRNGPVLEFPQPVTTRYGRPQQRILFNEVRNHNSIFAWAESLWMLAGRDDLAFLIPLNKGMAKYSDDGSTVRGSAYGKRWRSWFGHDQLESVIKRLRADINDRRCVIQHWDAATDNVINSKDVPCNTVLYPYVRPANNHAGYRLDLTVSCRSNDMIFGAYGSNAVHFSILQELIAAALKIPVGEYFQVSNSLHFYTENEASKKTLEAFNNKHPSFDFEGLDYTSFGVQPFPLVSDSETYEDFVKDTYRFFEEIDAGRPIQYSIFSTIWFREVWSPAWNSYVVWKYEQGSSRRLTLTLDCLADCQAEDLQLDLRRWYSRRAHTIQETKGTLATE